MLSRLKALVRWLQRNMHASGTVFTEILSFNEMLEAALYSLIDHAWHHRMGLRSTPTSRSRCAGVDHARVCHRDFPYLFHRSPQVQLIVLHNLGCILLLLYSSQEVLLGGASVLQCTCAPKILRLACAACMHTLTASLCLRSKGGKLAALSLQSSAGIMSSICIKTQNRVYKVCDMSNIAVWLPAKLRDLKLVKQSEWC